MEQNLANGSSKVFLIKIFYRTSRPGMFHWKKRKIKGKNYPASNRAKRPFLISIFFQKIKIYPV